MLQQLYCFFLAGLLSLLVLIGGCRSDRSAEETETTEETEFLPEELLADEPVIDTVPRAEIRKVLSNLFDLARKNECGNFHRFIIYTGRDSSRLYSDVLNDKDQNERFRAESTCEVIAMWLQGSASFEYGPYKTAPHPHPDVDSVYQQEVVFLGQTDINRQNFTFIKRNTDYLLMNID